MKKIKIPLRFWLVILVGLCLSIIFVFSLQSGLFGYWVALDPPPEKVNELVAIVGLDDLSPHLAISGMGGNQFECVTPKIGCYEWWPMTGDRRISRPVGKYSCNLQHPRFTIFTRPFDTVADCLEILFSAGGYGTTRYVYVLDGHGNLWTGIFTEDVEEIIPLFFMFLPVTLLLSFSVALIWELISSRHQPGLQENHAARRKKFPAWLWRYLRNAARFGSIPYFLFAYFEFKVLFDVYITGNGGPILDYSESLLFTSIAVCMLIAWRKPFAGGISGIVCFLIMISWMKLDILFQYYFFTISCIWSMAVLLAFIGSAVFKTPDSEIVQTPAP